MNYTFRPLGAWTEGDTKPRHGPTTFSASWPSTLDLLKAELAHLDARHVVIQADFTEADLRVDGMPRANARTPRHPGVRIAFDSRYGPLTYSTDAHAFWQHNVRAIALSLRNLRAVDRYGVTRRGEQYVGWKALPAAPNGPNPEHEALLVILRAEMGACYDATDQPEDLAVLKRNPALLRRTFRNARAAAHPDRNGGDRTAWDRLEHAGRVLGLTAGGTDRG